MWWIGDWLRYGERKWGEKYSKAIDVTDLAYQSLVNAKNVAEKFSDFNRRRLNLSWSHHSEVAALPLFHYVMKISGGTIIASRHHCQWNSAVGFYGMPRLMAGPCAKWVAGQYEFSDRSENLSWTHHRVIARLPKAERREVTARAIAENWSVRDTMADVNRRRAAIFRKVDHDAGRIGAHCVPSGCGLHFKSEASTTHQRTNGLSAPRAPRLPTTQPNANSRPSPHHLHQNFRQGGNVLVRFPRAYQDQHGEHNL